MAHYKTDESGIVTGIWYPATCKDFTGMIEITSPVQEFYTLNSGTSMAWKEVSEGVIKKRTQAQINADVVPTPLKSAKQIYSDIFDEFGIDHVTSTLKPELTPFFDTCLRQESGNGYALAKAEIDLTSLTQEDKDKIKSIIG